MPGVLLAIATALVILLTTLSPESEVGLEPGLLICGVGVSCLTVKLRHVSQWYPLLS